MHNDQHEHTYTGTHAHTHTHTHTDGPGRSQSANRRGSRASESESDTARDRQGIKETWLAYVLGRASFVLSPMNVIDVLAVLPFYIEIIVMAVATDSSSPEALVPTSTLH